MTWLSEIENEISLLRKNDAMGRKADFQRERMARVIRELAPRARAYEWITDNILLDEIFDGLVDAGIFIEDILSPDAKEVIDDCTAPSST